MIRLFLPPERLTSNRITITGDQARYLSLVLRVRPGDPLIIFDGLGNRYTCRIIEAHKKGVIAERIKKEIYSVESPLSITLAQGMPKGDRMDIIVQKSTELGVRRIIPLITERTQVRHTDKIERWKKIALSAAQQSGREKVPEVEAPLSFADFLNREKRYTGMIFSEEKKERNLKDVIDEFRDDIRDITILIGPEGGFSKNEVIAAIEKGFREVSLGPRILRTETASLVAIGIMQYEAGDLG
jgi:16S rRNA (uracil1498-N3)-methyltransferase